MSLAPGKVDAMHRKGHHGAAHDMTPGNAAQPEAARIG